MSKTKQWLLWGGILVLIGVLFFYGLAAILTRQALLKAGTPVYEYQTSASTHEGYLRQTLTISGITYISDYEEYGLTSAGNDFTVGKTSTGLQIIGVAGQNDYVVLYDFMSPIAVFRNQDAPSFDWHAINFNEMRLFPMIGPNTQMPDAPIVSTDKTLIAAALSPLRDSSTTPISPEQVQLAHTYFLNLYSDQLTGMWYIMGVYVSTDGKIYMAENTLSKEWFPASETFAEWVQ